MKYLLLFIFIIMVEKTFCQTQPQKPAYAIEAKDAYKHVGELVIVYDRLYSGKIVNDSTAVCQMGEETNTPRLTMIFICPIQFRPLDPRFLRLYKSTKIWLYGTITGSKEAPVIVLHTTRDINRDESHPL